MLLLLPFPLPLRDIQAPPLTTRLSYDTSPYPRIMNIDKANEYGPFSASYGCRAVEEFTGVQDGVSGGGYVYGSIMGIE